MSRLELRPFADEHLDAAAELLAERHRRHRAAEPALLERFEDAAAAREEVERVWRREGASGAAGFLDGRLVGGFIVSAAEQAGDAPHAFTGLARPERAAYLAWAVTRPEVRGSGTGVALTEASFAWARRRGYETMVTDWRVTNLLASRFWPRRGFRTTFLRLYRPIP